MSDLIDSFRDTMAQVAAPVSIVTTAVDEIPVGATISAFSSLSLYPPMVLIVLDGQRSLANQIETIGRFGLNLLTADQVAAASTFGASNTETRFETVSWQWRDELPHLLDSAGWITCEVDQIIRIAGHVIFIGKVEKAESRLAAPLNYHQRHYVTTVSL